MSETLKFYKGLEEDLPTTYEPGALYHCTDTGNTYLATSTTKIQLFSATMPPCSTSNNGQFLRVVNGKSQWETVQSAEGGLYGNG